MTGQLAMVHAHFIPDIRERGDADNLLRGKSAGNYLTFRFKRNLYNLSFVSSDGSVRHVSMGRLSDDRWCLPESEDDGSVFGSLDELLRSRLYLQLDESTEEPNASEDNNGQTARKRAATTGVAGLPSIPPLTSADENEEMPPQPTEGSETTRIIDIPPTCNHTFQTLLFIILGLLGIAGIVGSQLLHVRIDKSLTQFVATETAKLRSVLEVAAFDAATQLAALHTTTSETSPYTSGQCTAIAQAWRYSVCEKGIAPLQASMEAQAGWAVPLGGLFCIAAVSFFLIFLMLCVHTGKKTVMSLNGVEELGAGKGMSMRARWTTAFLLLLLSCGCAAWYFGSAAWLFGDLPTLTATSVRGFIVPPHLDFGKAEAMVKGREYNKEAVEQHLVSGDLPWRMDEFGAALSVYRLPIQCMKELHNQFNGILNNPAMLRLPLNGTGAVAAFLEKRALQNSAPKRDCFDIRDPMPSSFIWQQWFDGSSIVIPGKSGTSRTIIVIAGIALVAFIVLLMGFDQRQQKFARRGQHIKKD